MNTLIKSSVLFVGTTFVVVFLVIRSALVPSVLAFAPNEALAVGEEPNLRGMECYQQDWHGYETSGFSPLWCSQHTPGLSAYITVNSTTHKVQHVSYVTYDNNLTIGELIDAWGPPTDYSTDNYLVWKGDTIKSAYVVEGPNWGPFSKVAFISYWNEYSFSTTRPWRGFVNK